MNPVLRQFTVIDKGAREDKKKAYTSIINNSNISYHLDIGYLLLTLIQTNKVFIKRLVSLPALKKRLTWL